MEVGAESSRVPWANLLFGARQYATSCAFRTPRPHVHSSPASSCPCRLAPPSPICLSPAQAFAATLGAKPGASSGFLAAKPPIWERPAFVLWTAGAANPAVEEARWVSEDPATFKSVKEM